MSPFGCDTCGCTNQHPCWDGDTQDTCYPIRPTLCSTCHNEDETPCPTPTTNTTETNAPTGPSSSPRATDPSADDAHSPSPPINPSTSAIAKTSHSAATQKHAAPNTKTATGQPAKPSAPTHHHPATGDPVLDAELNATRSTRWTHTPTADTEATPAPPNKDHS